MNVNAERDLIELGITERRRDRGANGTEARCDCPFCPAPQDGKPRDPAFSVNLDTGVWRCHRCGEHGNMFQLRQRLKGGASVFHVARKAQQPQQPGRSIDPAQVAAQERALESNPRALAWLAETRKLTPDTIRRFRLGYADRGSHGAISIPYFRGEKCVGIKYRLLPPGDETKKYERETGCVMSLYNANALDGEYRAAVVTEGEFDTIALAQYDLGCPVVSVPDGATASLKEEAREALHHFDEFLLCFDQDEKGDEGAAKFAETMGALRCRRVRLPKKDANECLAAGVSREVMLEAVASARSCGVTAVRHISEWQNELLNPTPMSRGVSTGWTGLDHLLGGLRSGEVTLLTAETGVGKSTWTIDLARRQAERGRGVLIASLELGGRAVARKMLSNVAGALWDALEESSRRWAIGRLCEMPVFLLDHYGDIGIPQLRDEVTYAVRRFNVSLVVIDHLHFALGVRRAVEDERLLIDQAAHAIQVMALELGIHVVLVMHPAKIRADAEGKTRTPEIGDLKGSSGPAQFADNVFRLARKEPRTILTLLKVRSELGRKGAIVYGFNPQTLQFADLDAKAEDEARSAVQQKRDGRTAAAGRDD